MAFGSRDELLRIVFERHSPIPDFEDVLDTATDDLTATVRRLYQALAAALGREPRVAPAILAEVFARPASPTVQTLTQARGSSDAGCAWVVAERAGAARTDT